MRIAAAWVSISTASGEANTASNLGAGQGWYKTKVGVDLQFRSLTATSSKIALANNTNDVGIDVTEANLIHNNIGGTLGISKGGTGQTTATLGFDALSPMTTAGDIIVGGASGTRARLALGVSNLGTTAGIPLRQVLTVNAGGTDAVWNDPYPMPSSGRIWGIRSGFNVNGTNTTNGLGLLQGCVTGNGTGAASAFGTDSTDGNRANNVTGTSNVFARAGWFAPANSVMRKYNPTFTIRFRLGAAQTSSNAMLYIGLVNQTAQPTAGTSMLSTYLNSKIGVLFGFRPADTTWMIMSNNNIATAVYTSLTGLPNSGATDNSAHTLSITLNDTVPNINWSFDGVAQTTITDTTNSVPPSTTALNPIMILEAQSATSLSIFERWSQISQDAP